MRRVAPTDPGAIRPRALLSYAYFAGKDPESFMKTIKFGSLPDLMLDSGAFTAFTKGKPVVLTEYAAWLRRWLPVTKRYVNLDVIGDAEGTWTNQKRMEDMGLKPIPVFHTNESFTHLERYIDAGYKFIALGGMVPHSKRPNALLPWLVRCFKMAKPHGVVFHGLGISGFRLLRPLPWYSADSSGWSFVFRHRTAVIFDERAGTLKSYDRGESNLWRVAPTIRRLGYDPQLFASSATVRGSAQEAVAEVTALSYMRAERYIRRIHGPIAHPNEPDTEPGFKLYLVTTDDPLYGSLMRAAAKAQGRKV